MDIAARIGGDEFCVLAPEQDSANILKLGERLNAAVAEEVATPDEPPVGLSIGAVSCPEHGTEAEALIDIADKAMYRAKAAGEGVALGEADERTPPEDAESRRQEREPDRIRALRDYSIRPWRMPIATACVRVEASSFARMRLVWVRTVSVERPRRWATASVCMPSASIWRISRWRALSVRSVSSSTIVDDRPGST